MARARQMARARATFSSIEIEDELLEVVERSDWRPGDVGSFGGPKFGPEFGEEFGGGRGVGGGVAGEKKERGGK
eukprot:1017477-Pleurochrysis_carterae.AAC.1